MVVKVDVWLSKFLQYINSTVENGFSTNKDCVDKGRCGKCTPLMHDLKAEVNGCTYFPVYATSKGKGLV